MTAESFVDTNIVLYAASHDAADAKKKRIARKLLETRDVGFSVQVLQEFVAAATGKQRLGITDAETFSMIEALSEYPVLPITGPLVLHALEIRKRYGISYWDAAIVAAAVELDCKEIVSEDFNDGQIYEGVRARNPFRE